MLFAAILYCFFILRHHGQVKPIPMKDRQEPMNNTRLITLLNADYKAYYHYVGMKAEKQYDNVRLYLRERHSEQHCVCNELDECKHRWCGNGPELGEGLRLGRS